MELTGMLLTSGFTLTSPPSENTAAWFGGGYTFNGVSYVSQSTIQRITFATDTAASSVRGPLSAGTKQLAAAGNTTLGTESARVALTSTTVTAAAVAYVATFPAGTPASLTAITEAGLFNASSAGTMLCRTVFSVVNKDAGDTMSITWTVTMAAP